MTSSGLITISSIFSVEETARRLVASIIAHGLSVFAQIDHAKNAADVAMTLRPTLLVIFGNPKGGTPLMQENQTSGIDLPVKALVWQDADDHVWLTYNDAKWIAERHHLATTGAIATMTNGLAAIAKAATEAS